METFLFNHFGLTTGNTTLASYAANLEDADSMGLSRSSVKKPLILRFVIHYGVAYFTNLNIKGSYYSLQATAKRHTYQIPIGRVEVDSVFERMLNYSNNPIAGDCRLFAIVFISEFVRLWNQIKDIISNFTTTVRGRLPFAKSSFIWLGLLLTKFHDRDLKLFHAKYNIKSKSMRSSWVKRIWKLFFGLKIWWYGCWKSWQVSWRIWIRIGQKISKFELAQILSSLFIIKVV